MFKIKNKQNYIILIFLDKSSNYRNKYVTMTTLFLKGKHKEDSELFCILASSIYRYENV